MVSIQPAQDTFIGPIVERLAQIIEKQIDPPPAKVYRLAPDHAPQDNTTTIILNQYKVTDDTNCKLEMRFVFTVTHWWILTPHLADAINKAYHYLMAYVLA